MRMRDVLIAGVLGSCAGLAWGQAGESMEPQVETEAIEPAGETDGRTVDWAIPGLDEFDARPPSGELLREGSFVTGMTGWLRSISSGGWALITPGESGEGWTGVLLVPSARLMEMTRAQQASEEPLLLSVGGEVLLYRGRNYVWVTWFEVANPEGAFEETSGDEGEKIEVPAEGDVAALIESFEDEGATRPLIGVGGPLEAGAGNASVQREGEAVIARVGRVTRSIDGHWAFAPENDEASGDDEDSAERRELTLLPCRNLERIEALTERYGSMLRLTLSGRLSVYEGRNYLLPTAFVIEVDRDGNLVPAQ